MVDGGPKDLIDEGLLGGAALERQRSERFLNAFIGIEGILHARYDGDSKRHVPFYQLVDHAAETDDIVKTNQVELKEYADLRNAIVHERIDGEPIAEPHEEAVKALEKIRALLERPPTVGEFYTKPIIVCQPSDRIGEAAAKMLEKGFSQIPVYSDGRCLDVLTSDTITRWLAARFSNGIELLEEETVAEVLKFTSKKPHHDFIGRSATIMNAIARFEEFSRRGARLAALIITEDGDCGSEPCGIITTGDLTDLYEKVELRRIEWR